MKKAPRTEEQLWDRKGQAWGLSLRGGKDRSHPNGAHSTWCPWSLLSQERLAKAVRKSMREGLASRGPAAEVRQALLEVPGETLCLTGCFASKSEAFQKWL